MRMINPLEGSGEFDMAVQGTGRVPSKIKIGTST